MLIPTIEKLHYKRLEEKNIVIEDHFWNGNNKDKRVWIRSTDGLRNDNVFYRKRKEKRYFINNNCIHVENDFSKLYEYTFVFGNNNEQIIKCPNCGNKGANIDFFNGCPCCGTTFNVSYKRKNVYFSVLDFSFLFKFKWLLLAILILIFLALSFFAASSGDFLQLLLILAFLPMFSLCALTGFVFFVVLIENFISILFKDLQNIKNKVISDVSTQLSLYLYNTKESPKHKDLIDFDIISFDKFEWADKDNTLAFAHYNIRKVYLVDGKVITKVESSIAKVKKNEIMKNNNSGFIKCNSCGASINILSKVCNYCHSVNNNLTEWHILNINEL